MLARLCFPAESHVNRCQIQIRADMLRVLPKDFPKGFFRFGIFPPAQIELTQVVVGLYKNRFDANGLDILFYGAIFSTQFCQRVSMIEEHDLDIRIHLLCTLEIRIRLGIIVAVKGRLSYCV